MDQEQIDYRQLGEKDLIRLARHDKEAFGRLYELHVDRIYNYLFYRLGNKHETEDLTSRVFVRAIKHIGAFEDKGVPFSAWLYRIARNMLANWYRDTNKRQMIPLETSIYDQVVEGPELASLRIEDQDTLLAAVRRLPAERQELLILKYVERMSNNEIGEIMGRTEGAIKSLYYRTLVSLRNDLLRTSSQQLEQQPSDLDSRRTGRSRWPFLNGKRRKRS